MSPADPSQQQPDDSRDHLPIQCDACESALHSRADHAVSFLLLDQLTLPLVGCDDHLEQFTAVCGLTTRDTADLLLHRPAGGVVCPGCRLAPRSTDHPLIPVQDGAVAVLACPEHRVAIVDRFHTGLDTQKQLTAPFDASL
jgi:hypothetical protein